jgi:hypothetical protein
MHNPETIKGGRKMEKQLTQDPKEDIQFWLDALCNPNLDEKTITLLNQSLQLAIYRSSVPVYVFKL